MALILIVDDSMTTRKAVYKVVKAAGYETLEATNGREGLEILDTRTPDCIVLDLIMPEVDGMEVLSTLRERGSEIPVIVLTADIQEIVRNKCLELGAVAFVNKPLIQQQLTGVIKKVLDSKKETSDERNSWTN